MQVQLPVDLAFREVPLPKEQKALEALVSNRCGDAVRLFDEVIVERPERQQVIWGFCLSAQDPLLAQHFRPLPPDRLLQQKHVICPSVDDLKLREEMGTFFPRPQEYENIKEHASAFLGILCGADTGINITHSERGSCRKYIYSWLARRRSTNYEYRPRK